MALLCSLLLLVSVQILTISGQCTFPTPEVIAEELEEALVGLFQDIASDIVATVTVNQSAVTCLSVSEMRDRYRITSALVSFSFTGVRDYDDCLAGERCIALVSFECDGSTTTWAINPLLVAQSIRTINNFTGSFDDITPRRDCGSCNQQALLPGRDHDPDTNCFLCSEVCRNVGLSYCTGLIDDECCSFYQMNRCVAQCPEGRVPDENFDCVCRNSFVEPDCNTCGLMCVNGAPDSECSVCVCEAGFTGDDCSVNIDDCANVTCVNGQCIDMINGSMCNCSIGFEGEFCEINIDDCEAVNCGNGVCVDGIDGFQCICSVDFTGAFCDAQIDDCLMVNCNNGSCEDGVGEFICNCPPNYSGTFCEVCDVQNCKICSLTQLNVCDICFDGFMLTDNGTCIDPCSQFTCLNNGTCVSPGGVAMCQCPGGFEGSNCEIDIDECAEGPCVSSNTIECMDGQNSFTCVCRNGFTGELCEVNIDDCDLDSCQNGGTCVDGIDSFSCDCPPNFQGTTCEVCTIVNCAECSLQEEGVCTTCDTNYKPDFRMRGCALDSRAVCANETCPAQCQFNLESQQYNTAASNCGITTSNPPSFDENTSPETRFQTSLNYYRTQYNNWFSICQLGTRRPTTEDSQLGFIDQWRNELRNWKDTINQWLNKTKLTNVPPLPAVDCDRGDPEEVYQELLHFYSKIIQQFQEEATCM